MYDVYSWVAVDPDPDTGPADARLSCCAQRSGHAGFRRTGRTGLVPERVKAAVGREAG